MKMKLLLILLVLSLTACVNRVVCIVPDELLTLEQEQAECHAKQTNGEFVSTCLARLHAREVEAKAKLQGIEAVLDQCR